MPKSEVYNRDCMEGMKEYEDNYFDLAVVDPPYGIGESNKDVSRNGFGAYTKKETYTPKDWDSNSPDEEYFTELKRVSKNQIIWGANHFLGWTSSCWIVWDKNNGDNDFADCELAWTSFKSAVRLFQCTWNGMLQHDMKNKEVRIHPTQKPIKLYDWIFKNYTKEGDKILDTHLGSGSSRIAADKAGLDFTGFEIDKEYFDASCKRYSQHKAQLVLSL